jgi:hypothetical protein
MPRAYCSKARKSLVLVAHTCNPSYSGGRDQEDYSSKPAQANNSWECISKIPMRKMGWQNGSSGRAPAWQAWGPLFKPHYHLKKKKKKRKEKKWGKQMYLSTTLSHLCHKSAFFSFTLAFVLLLIYCSMIYLYSFFFVALFNVWWSDIWVKIIRSFICKPRNWDR